MERLISSLYTWDSVHTEHLINIYDTNVSGEPFFDDLISITNTHQDLQIATTWLIKHHYDQKQKLSEQQGNLLLGTILNFKAWEAKLHVLQILPFLSIPESHFILVEDFVRACLNDDVKFVRAWAYQGFYELTKYQPSYIPELKLLCDKALLTESASIKSRVKKVVKQLEKR
ncbi:MAG: hypothetical protein AAF901_02190 [Bacteroidota bacterium]